jgi:hypothetical protein
VQSYFQQAAAPVYAASRHTRLAVQNHTIYAVIYRMIPSVLDPRKCEYLKDYSLFNLIFCKYVLYL